jgi:hypothetical protein
MTHERCRSHSPQRGRPQYPKNRSTATKRCRSVSPKNESNLLENSHEDQLSRSPQSPNSDSELSPPPLKRQRAEDFDYPSWEQNRTHPPGDLEEVVSDKDPWVDMGYSRTRTGDCVFGVNAQGMCVDDACRCMVNGCKRR